MYESTSGAHQMAQAYLVMFVEHLRGASDSPSCWSALFRCRERLHVLLEEEKGQRQKSWQDGISALEDHQQQLLEAQRSAAQALSETDTCLFVHRYESTMTY